MRVVDGDIHNQFRLQHSRDQFSEMVNVRRFLSPTNPFLLQDLRQTPFPEFNVDSDQFHCDLFTSPRLHAGETVHLRSPAHRQHDSCFHLFRWFHCI